jgi:hypothetical protein
MAPWIVGKWLSGNVFFNAEQQLHSIWTASRPDPALECPVSWQVPGKSGALLEHKGALTVFPGWPDYKYLFFRRQATSIRPPLYC